MTTDYSAWTTLPSLEPVVNAVRDALIANLQDALDHAATLYPDDGPAALNLSAPVDPRDYRVASFQSFGAVDTFPLVTITAGGLVEQDGQGRRWEGPIQIVAWLPDYGREGSVRAVWRWAAAIWLVCITSAPFETTAGLIPMIPHTAEFDDAAEESETQYRRVVGVRFRVSLRA